MLLNAHNDEVPFTVPPLDADRRWQCVFDTVEPAVNERLLMAGGQYPLQGRSVAVLKVWPPIRERRRRSEAAPAAITAPVAEELTLTASNSIDAIQDSPRGGRVTAARPGASMADDPLWYKDAFIYEVHVMPFFDSSHDVIGDFQGLTQKLDHQ